MAYGSAVLFEGLTVDIDGGRRVIVTGANGTGKTTFLKIIAGLVRPVAGKVQFDIDGHDYSDPAERRRLGGYAGPDVNVYEVLSAVENLEFQARLRGVPVDGGLDLLKRAGLKKSKQKDPVRTYSSGMRQRVRLAAALLSTPSILLWDEPSAMLDEGGRSFVDSVLGDHVDAGVIAVIATNDPADIDRWGDRRLHFDG